MLLVEFRRPERDPVVLRLACEVVLREVRTIHRRIRIRADHRQRALVAFAPDHLGGGDACGASADNHD
jgi:hypothetical protein